MTILSTMSRSKLIPHTLEFISSDQSRISPTQKSIRLPWSRKPPIHRWPSIEYVNITKNISLQRFNSWWKEEIVRMQKEKRNAGRRTWRKGWECYYTACYIKKINHIYRQENYAPVGNFCFWLLFFLLACVNK